MRIGKRSVSNVLIILIISSIFLLSACAWIDDPLEFERAILGCNGDECHDVENPLAVPGITGLPSEYDPDVTYPLTIHVTGEPSGAHGGFSFQVSEGTLSNPGSLVAINTVKDKARHTNSTQRSWTLDWTAPERHSGEVNFWLSALCADGNDGRGGDYWNQNSWVIPEHIPDFEAPRIASAKLNGKASQQYPFSSVPSLKLAVVIDDSQTGNFNVMGANYTKVAMDWDDSVTMTMMSPPPGPTESFEATIPAPASAGLYEFYPYGWDEYGNCNDTNDDVFATLDIVDDLPPFTAIVLVDGAPSRTVKSGSVVQIRAVLDDSENGDTWLTGANFTLGYHNWNNGQTMTAQDSSYDSSIEIVTASLDTAGMCPGTYRIYVQGLDGAGNSPSNPLNTANLTITTSNVPDDDEGVDPEYEDMIDSYINNTQTDDMDMPEDDGGNDTDEQVVGPGVDRDAKRPENNYTGPGGDPVSKLSHIFVVDGDSGLTNWLAIILALVAVECASALFIIGGKP